MNDSEDVGLEYFGAFTLVGMGVLTDGRRDIYSGVMWR